MSRPGDNHVQQALAFIQKHESFLLTVERTTRSVTAECPDTHYRPIRFAIQPTERVFPHDIILTDNEPLRKLLIVLAFICDEIHDLKQIAESKLYVQLNTYGHLSEFATNAPCNASEISPLRSGEKERIMGNFLSQLQDISNFTCRCRAVALNLVQQLSQLLRPQVQLYKATFQAARLLPVFQALGDLLTVLITLDTIIRQNDLLLESWKSYKAMISFARADPAAFGTDGTRISTFERLLVSIDQQLMSGDIFKNCIEQDYEIVRTDEQEDLIDRGGDGISIAVRTNETFLEELLSCLKVTLDSTLSVLDTSNELSERGDIVGCFALYALYRRLLPRQVLPDKKLYKHLWGVQKQVPLVVLFQNSVWSAGEFLQQHAPFELKHPDPPNPALYSRTYLAQFDQSLGRRTAALLSQCAAWFVLAESKLQV
jgi:WASH complex subunit 7